MTTIKDSGEREVFASGGQRDTETGKPRYDLLFPKAPPYEEQILYRWAVHMGLGAEKYAPRNWEKFCTVEELERAKSSLLRHVMQLVNDETDEDHAAAIMANVMFIEHIKYKLQVMNGVTEVLNI